MWTHIVYSSACNGWEMAESMRQKLVYTRETVELRMNSSAEEEEDPFDPYSCWDPIIYMMQKCSKLAVVSKFFHGIRMEMWDRIRLAYQSEVITTVGGFRCKLEQELLWTFTITFTRKVDIERDGPCLIKFPTKDVSGLTHRGTYRFLHREADPIESVKEGKKEVLRNMHETAAGRMYKGDGFYYIPDFIPHKKLVR